MLLACACIVACGAPPILAKSVKIHGYITEIKSPTEFEIDDYRITRDSSLALEFEKSTDPDETTDFRPEDLRVGTEVEIQGELDDATRLLSAKSVKVNLEDHNHIKRTALMEIAPHLTKVGKIWQGQIHADGQHIVVTEDTIVTIKLNNTQKRAAKKAEKAAKKERAEESGAEDNDKPEAPLERAHQIPANTFVTYDGRRQKDGSILAKKIEFVENELNPAEARLWKMLTPKVKAPNPYFSRCIGKRPSFMA